MFTWWRRPESRFGPLLAGVGFSYSVASLNASAASLAYTIGMVIWAAVIVYLAYVYLCFPRGRLESRIERVFMRVLVVSTAAVWAAILVISPTLPVGGSFNDCGARCPGNALQIVSGYAGTGAVLKTTFNIVFTISLIGIAMLIFNKARSPARRRRRQLAPLSAVFIASIVEFVIALFLIPAYPGTRDALRIADGLLTIGVPVAILIGQIRGDRSAAITLGRIAVRASGRTMTPVAAQQVIRDGLGDPALTLALWDPERAEYLDVEGTPVDIPRDPWGRAVTRLIRDDWPVAALIHDPTLEVSAEVFEGLAAASLMLLDNARLVEELRSSRSRIVETADRERRRLEQDLHDGAQQRLVAVQVRLGLAREVADTDELRHHLDAAQREAQAALDELRAVAHGIYPQTLRNLGLAAALGSLATSSTIPLRVIDRGIGRSSSAIEGAIYFCVRESIQNASKHAGQDAAVTVTLARQDGALEFTVSDDGVGMAPGAPNDGMGVRGMRDRIEAVGGDFEITSTPGQGTRVRGTVPTQPNRRGGA
jgi:signal transduction histidine kinase